MNKYDKGYFEKYALFSICHLLKLDRKEFEKNSERPDLQSKTLNIGIEVVRAITEHDGLTYSLINEYFGQGLSGDEIVAAIKRKNTKGKFRGSVFSANGVAAISSEEGLYDIAKHRNLISEYPKKF